MRCRRCGLPLPTHGAREDYCQPCRREVAKPVFLPEWRRRSLAKILDHGPVAA